MISYFTFILVMVIFLILALILLRVQRMAAEQAIKKYEEDIKFLREQFNAMEEKATIDELTGIHNRRYIIKRLKEEMERAVRYQHPLQILFLDVNNFKAANDTYGHNLGDEILKKIAKILRSYDICGRYGGDEFVVILPETEKSRAYVVAGRIMADVEKLAKQLVPKINMGISAGISSYPGDKKDDISVENLLKEADEAMYKQKRAAQKARA